MNFNAFITKATTGVVLIEQNFKFVILFSTGDNFYEFSWIMASVLYMQSNTIS